MKHYSDEPALLDDLERFHLIEKLGDAIAECTPPHAFGIHGDWGAGKTSFLHLLHLYLTGKCPEQPKQFVLGMNQGIVQRAIATHLGGAREDEAQEGGRGLLWLHRGRNSL